MNQGLVSFQSRLRCCGVKAGLPCGTKWLLVPLIPIGKTVTFPVLEAALDWRGSQADLIAWVWGMECVDWFLSPPGLAVTESHGWRLMGQRTFVHRSPGSGSQGGRWAGQVLVRLSWVAASQSPTVSSCCGRTRELSGASFIKAQIPFMNTSPRVHHLPKALAPDSTTLGLRMSTQRFWRDVENWVHSAERCWRGGSSEHGAKLVTVTCVLWDG